MEADAAAADTETVESNEAKLVVVLATAVERVSVVSAEAALAAEVVDAAFVAV